MATMFGFVGLGVCGASLFLALLALALPYWQSYELVIYSTKVSVHGGLFRSCVDATCADILDAKGVDKSSYQATQAMVLLGFFALTGAQVSLGLFLFILKGRKILGYIAGGLAMAGGFFLMVGMGIYANKLKIEGADYGAGFAFDVLGWLAAWAAAGIILFMTFTTGGAES